MEKTETKLSKSKRIAAEVRSQFVTQTSMLMTSAFGLVAAFAWNELVRDAIDRYIAPGNGLKSRLIYAIFVTILAVLVSYQFGKLAAKYKIEDEDKK